MDPTNTTGLLLRGHLCGRGAVAGDDDAAMALRYTLEADGEDAVLLLRPVGSDRAAAARLPGARPALVAAFARLYAPEPRDEPASFAAD